MTITSEPTMSINQNAAQFGKQKSQPVKRGPEPVSFPPRYQPPPAAAAPPSSHNKLSAGTTAAGTTAAAADADAPAADANSHKAQYLTGPGPHPAGGGPFPKYPQSYPSGYPLPPGAIRVLRPSAEVVTHRAVVHDREPTVRARSADDTHRAQRNLEEEQVHRRSADMLKFTKRVEPEGTPRAPAGDQRRQLRLLLDEVKALKEANRRLSDDNQELRDLCCFLDDDRQKGRKLAREWQRFGRYTASVMRQEVSAYQAKLRELDDKQHELIRDNLELKELCLYLDEERERGGTGRERDDGDGSSGGTIADEGRAPHLADRTLQYVRDLEHKVRRLEAERGGAGGAGERPEAVVRALQVLEVRERVERERPAVPLAAPEQALVREMCNVVWGKLEDAPPLLPPHPPR